MTDLSFSGRIEGPARVTGHAVYEGDVQPPGMLHAVLVEAPITRGRVLEIDDAAREFVRVSPTSSLEGRRTG